MSDLFAVRETPLQAVRDPLPVAPLSFGERFDLDFRAQRGTGTSFSAERNYQRTFTEAAQAFREAGEIVENPFDVAEGSGTLADLGRIVGGVLMPQASGLVQRAELRAREDRLRRWDEVAERLRARSPEAPDLYPTAAELRIRADQEARAAVAAAERAVGYGGGFGGFLGQAAAIFTDPMQLATLPLGAPWRLGATLLGNVVRTALVEGAVAGATQAAVELRADPYRRSIGLEGGGSDEIAIAALGGAIFGGGLRGVLGLLAGRTLPDTPGGVLAGDAERAARTQLIEQAGNPGGPEAAAANIRALEAGRQQMARGQPVTVFVEPARPSRYATERETRLSELQAAAEVAPGQRFQAFTPAGRAVVVEARVVELAQLVPSHSPDGVRNPAYPHDEGIQPRPRGDAPLQDQVREIAARLEPARLMPGVEASTGAPIIGEDLVVESGNGRVAALMRVYRDPALAEQREAYRQALIARGYAVEGLTEPVVVSRRLTALAPAERAAFVREANARATAEAGTAQRARDDARLVGDALPLWRGGDVDSVANAPFARRVLEALGPAERAGLLDAAGRLNEDGMRRIGNALMARAYGDDLGPLLDRMLSTSNEGMRGVAGALRDVAGAWAAMRDAAARGTIEPGMDATADLAAAIRLMDEARRRGIRLADLILQADLDLPAPTDTTIAFLASLHRDGNIGGAVLSRQRIAQRLDAYVEGAMRTEPGGGLFGLPPVRPAEQLGAVARREGDAVPAPDGPATPTADVPAEPAAPVFRFDPAPDGDAGVARARDLLQADQQLAARRGAVTDRALLGEARRVAAQGGVDVPAGEGGLTRPAIDVLADAEAELQDAAEAVACLIGAAA